MTNGERWIEVKLLGELGRRFGRTYKFLVKNPREVISALSRQIEGFKDYLCYAHENGMAFRLVTDDPDGIDYEQIDLSCSRLIIAPIIAGSGGKGFSIGQILLGVALVALAFIPGFGIVSAGQAAANSALTAGALTKLGTSLLTLGIGLVLTGIAGLIAPSVQTPKGDSKKKESFVFDRAVELTSQGYPVPLVYGQYLVQSPLYISSSISTENISV
jgi:predicted phage tail protein